MTNVLVFTNNSHFVPFTTLQKKKATDGYVTKSNKLMDGLKEQICVDTLWLRDVLTIGPGKPSPFGPSGPSGPGSPRSPYRHMHTFI